MKPSSCYLWSRAIARRETGSHYIHIVKLGLITEIVEEGVANKDDSPLKIRARCVQFRGFLSQQQGHDWLLALGPDRVVAAPMECLMGGSEEARGGSSIRISDGNPVQEL